MAGFQKVTRQKGKLRMALMGPSGSGKTLSALYLAYGLTGDWNKIALIDTEHERARLYIDRKDLGTGDFYYQSMSAPYSVERYQLMVAEGAELVGSDGVVIVDSFSHAWSQEGGVLDKHQTISQQAGKTSYTAWNEAGKEQNKLVNSILAVDSHVIVTMRVKTDYVLEVNAKGKTEPRKVGLAPVQREDAEYEFDTVLSIDKEHIATVSKDITILEGYRGIISIDLGRRLGSWLNDGVDPSKCEVCNSIIHPCDGRTAEVIIENTKKQSGQTMCMSCFKNWKAGQKTADTKAEE